MQITQQQLDANRANAQKSTGPKTQTGKANSSRNALKHGRHTRDAVIRSKYYAEDPAQYELLHASVTFELRPVTAVQKILVRKITDCLWRSQRVLAIESAHILDELDDVDPQMNAIASFSAFLDRTAGRELREPSRREQSRKRYRRSLRCLVPDNNYTRDLQMYEMRLERQLTRLYNLYNLVQRTVPIDSPCDQTNPSHDALQEIVKTNPFADASQQLTRTKEPISNPYIAGLCDNDTAFLRPLGENARTPDEVPAHSHLVQLTSDRLY